MPRPKKTKVMTYHIRHESGRIFYLTQDKESALKTFKKYEGTGCKIIACSQHFQKEMSNYDMVMYGKDITPTSSD